MCTRGQRLEEAQEREEVQVPDCPLDPQTLPACRVEELECVLEELTINKRKHGKIVSQTPSRIDDNGTLSLAARSPLKDAPIISFVVGLVLCSAEIHLVLQSVLFEELARSGRKTAPPFYCLLESFLDNTV
jgi:hypothetical protein